MNNEKITKEITIELDSETLTKANRLLEELGLTMSSAITMFLRQTISENGLPFTPKRAKSRQVNNDIAKVAEETLAEFGLDIDTAVSLFLQQVAHGGGVYFDLFNHRQTEETRQAVHDALHGENLIGPFDSVESAFASISED